MSFSVIFLQLVIEIIFRGLWSIINVLIPCIVTESQRKNVNSSAVLWNRPHCCCSFLKKIVAYKMTTTKDNFD
jgi:hypothetical protein